MELKEKIKGLAKDLHQETIKNRRHIHANPELSFEEKETSKFVAKKLNEMGITPQENIGGYGLVATIEGKNPSSKVIALRADMDALPIQELNDKPYKSKNDGVMHACGHDCHTSSLLSTVNILNQCKDDFEGTVKFVFQPAEEKAPGGASIMIKEGVLKNPTPNAMFGQHVAPNLKVGTLGFREGMYMASTDEIYMTIIGKGGHGAAPNLCIDPILIASHIIVALQQIISRNKVPYYPSVLSFGRFIGDGVTNVIPDKVEIEGTFRNMNEEWREEGLMKMKKMAEGIAESMGAVCDFQVVRGYPFLKNNPELTKEAKNFAINYVGKENVIDLDLWMAGEDFAFYSQVVDSCFYRLGTSNEAKGIDSGVHTPTFDIDEKALEIGSGFMAYLAIENLNKK